MFLLRVHETRVRQSRRLVSVVEIFLFVRETASVENGVILHCKSKVCLFLEVTYAACVVFLSAVFCRVEKNSL